MTQPLSWWRTYDGGVVNRGPARALLLLLVAAALTSGCGSDGGSTPSGPGSPSPTTPTAVNVVGTLDRSGATGSCFPGEPCDPPATAALLVFTGTDGTVVRVPVSGPGRFRTRLAPGTYTVSLAPALPGVAVAPDRLTVPDAGTVHPEFALTSR